MRTVIVGDCEPLSFNVLDDFSRLPWLEGQKIVTGRSARLPYFALVMGSLISIAGLSYLAGELSKNLW